MEKLIKILESIKPNVDYKNEEHLIDNNILTSMDIVKLVVELSSQYDIEISPLYIVPENFNSAKAMLEMIERIEEE